MTTEQDFAWREAALRFRFAGIATLVLAAVGWIAWLYPFDDLLDRSGTPLGGDYVMLYVAGQTIANGQSHTLYDDGRNQQRSSSLFPTMNPHESWPYRYPPTVAAVMAPLSHLPFLWSYVAFSAIQLSLLGACLMLWRNDFASLRRRPEWLWAIAGSPLVIEVLVGGQSSLLALLCVLGFAHYYRQENDWLAGGLLALTLYKPNVLALFILGCLLVRPRLLRGFVPTVAVGVALAIATCGLSGLLEYLRLGTQLASSAWSLETPYWKVHGLAPFFQQGLPQHGKLLCFVTGAVLSAVIAGYWRAGRVGPQAAMACLLCSNALFNPYVPIYDLVLLIAALLFACQAACNGECPSLKPGAFQLLAAALFLGPHLSQIAASVLGWQPFPVFLLAALVALATPARLYWLNSSPTPPQLRTF